MTIKFSQIHSMGNPTDNPYLARSYVRNVSYNSEKTNQTVSWSCWPNEYQYAYTHGGKRYYGFLSGGTPSSRGGIYRPTSNASIWETSNGSGYYYISEMNRVTRRGIFEGIRIREIRYKSYTNGTNPNNVSWNKRGYSSINSYDDATVTLSSSKNNTVFEIEVDYELCTMGFPHRTVPFFYYSRKGYNYMANGSKFTNTKPGREPGRSYSKVGNAWKFDSFEWGDPRATTASNKTKVGWAYKNGNSNDGLYDSERTAWSTKYTWEYQTKRPYLGHTGWASDTPYAPQYARKSCYWTYVRTYKDKFITNGIWEKPAQLQAPNMPVVNVIKNHCDTDLRGEGGTVRVKYTHPTGNSGFITLYAVQNISNNQYKVVAVSSNRRMSHNETYSIDVDFRSLNLTRSKEVRYCVTARVDDPYYTDKTVTTGSGLPTSYLAVSDMNNAWNGCFKNHYYNEEPQAPAIYLENPLHTAKEAIVTWNYASDPDGDIVKYSVYIQRQGGPNPNSGYFHGGVSGQTSYEKVISHISANKVSIDMSNYNYLEEIKVWLQAWDVYYNSYYYTSAPITIQKIQTPTVSLTASQPKTLEKNPITGQLMTDGTKGKVSIKYRHEVGVPGTVTVEAHQAIDVNGTDGRFFKTLKTLTFDSTMINSNQLEYSQSFDIDFIKEGFTRSRDIKYFLKGQDANGNKTYSSSVISWNDCTYGHRFNEEPEPVTPWIENLSTINQDEIAIVKWNEPKDTDGDTNLFYKVYLKCEDNTKNSKSKQFYGPYINRTEKFAKEFITSNTYFKIDISEYNDDELYVWVESHDYYVNDYYYSGPVIPFENTGLAPNIPKIIVYPAHGEEGELSVQYSHNTGRNGYISLYAICEYLDKSRKIFTLFTDKYISNGETYYYDCDFIKNFGKEPKDRSCNIRYFATARTQGFDSDEVCTVPSGWKPTVDMYEDWTGGHYFNEEPPKTILTLDTEKSNLYKNAYLSWTGVTDPDDDNVRYQIYLRAKSAEYNYDNKYTYFYGVNREEDKMMYCDLIAETTNNYLDIDLTHYETYAEEFDVWVKPWDLYENSYYYNSDVVHFQKLEYSRPVVELDVTPVHGEKGELTITYTHPDALLTGDAAIDRGCTDGIVELYAYIEGIEYSPINITNLINDNGVNEPAVFVHGQMKTITVDFSLHLNSFRSRNISYFAIARDKNDDPGIYSTDYTFTSVPSEERSYGHYFNGVPNAPDPYDGTADSKNDRRIYDFIYTNILWNKTADPDEDIVDYYLYIQTPSSMNEDSTTEIFTCNGKTLERSYNRKYKIEPIYDKVTEDFMYYQISIFKDNAYKPLYTKPNLCFRLDYVEGDTEWTESINNNGAGIYHYWVESRDRYNNSYYNSSTIITKERKQHEKPNKVQLTCTPAHSENGNLRIKYTHPENLDATIYLYAYLEKDTKPILINKFDFIFTEEQLNEYDKTGIALSIEQEYNIDFTKNIELKRSNNIVYYAVAIDTLVNFKSDDRDLTEILYEEKATGHYYNEEPPCTTPMFLFDVANDFYTGNAVYEETPFNEITLVWKKVLDPDGDNVNYNIYMEGLASKVETKSKYFYGDYSNDINIGELNTSNNEEQFNNLLDEDAYDLATLNNLKQYAEGELTYNFYKQLTPNNLNKSNIITHKETGEEYYYYTFDIDQYDEDGILTIWIETDDNYENSYYRSGKILVVQKGHKARDIDAAWPRSYTTICAKTPRIVVKLAEDNLRQELQVFWKDTWYSNKNSNHLKYFSCAPKITAPPEEEVDQYIVFRPPIHQTTIHDSKITYGVKVHNTCTESESLWFEYSYHQFGYNLSESKFIPIKYAHMNQIRPYVQKLMDAYGKDYLNDEGFIIKDRVINKDSIVDNEDYNEIANPLRALNDYINTIDKTTNMDDDSNVVIKYDLDLIEYEENVESAYMTSDFKEWKILLYLLQNM